jgi:DNA ligase D-like protein (predicted polymerase)/DNA ligase D-like protein (predicted 3'-phosphoesterase)
MTLVKYKTKRNFKESPEPAGGKADSDKLRFVIQKHDASQLHYDFRLELDGVLKSWAVPKGPSTDPSVKRLAMMVEDHPYDYRNFEGTIPSGYGAGTVMIWDEGFYEPADLVGADKKDQEKVLRKNLHQGKLHFILYGKKLKGEFAIIKTSLKGKNSWLLFKVKDNFVNKADITLKNKSVVSKRTLRQIEKNSAGKNGKSIVKKTSELSKKKALPERKLRNDVKNKINSNIINNKERKTLLNPSEDTQVKKINGHELKFTNLNKIYWPAEKIAKRDLLNYYYQITPYILPYLMDRPQSMNRNPNGINGPSFYFKDITGKAPEWIETFLYHSESDGRNRKYLVAKDEASLLYMASLGCIEMNPWHSRVESEDYPDWCIIDLDPGNNSFEDVIKAARITKDILDNFGVDSYPKTSGSTGIHIYIPLAAEYTYDQSREFARIVALMVHEKLPAITSIERIVKNRKGKMYIDFLQNRPQATICAPYSVRPKPGATVSMPLHWEEVKKGLKMKDFNIRNGLGRIKMEGDIFKPVIGKGIDLLKAINAYTASN